MPWLMENWGNPSSAYGMGRSARRAIEEAREQVAKLVGAGPEQVVFTSGATEASNSAIHSAIFNQPHKRHIVTSAVEHSAVLNYCKYLGRYHPVEVTRLPVSTSGLLDLAQLVDSIREDTAMVSLMWGNNETGVVWPIPEITEICRDKQTLFHTDAVQAVGKLPVSVQEAGVDYLSLSGHKFGGPKGVGALILKNTDTFLPMLHGGKQENGRRGGTENVAAIAGLGVAAEIAARIQPDNWAVIEKLRDHLENRVLGLHAGAIVNGSQSERLPNTSNIYLPGIDADALVTMLDQRGICISSGSACMESAITPSHVILAMSGSYDRANESIRISLGLETTEQEISDFVEALSESIDLLS